jgi:hypothetical protein
VGSYSQVVVVDTVVSLGQSVDCLKHRDYLKLVELFATLTLVIGQAA